MRQFHKWASVAVTSLLGAGLAVTPAAAEDDVVYGTLSLLAGDVVYRAMPGLVNDQYVNWGNSGGEPGPPSFMGDDYWDHQITVADSCGTSQSIYVTCHKGGATPRVLVYLGDGDDQGHAGNELGHGRTVVQYGEDGNDKLSGDDTTDILYGGPGNDTFVVDGQGALGSTAISAGDVVGGGDGIDTLTLHDHSSVLIRVTLDGVADDGDVAADRTTSEEADNYLSDVENIVGGRQAPHLIVGSTADNVITIDNSFADTVDGGLGADTISTGGGDDTILLRDGVADTLDCGAGSDRAVVDVVDVVGNCEAVDRPGAEPSPPVSDAVPVPVPGASTATAAKVVDAKPSRKRATVRVACTGLGDCTGSIVVRRKATGKRPGPILARGHYAVPAGERGRVSVKVTRAGRRALARSARVKVRLELSASTRAVATSGGSTRNGRLTR